MVRDNINGLRNQLRREQMCLRKIMRAKQKMMSWTEFDELQCSEFNDQKNLLPIKNPVHTLTMKRPQSYKEIRVKRGSIEAI